MNKNIQPNKLKRESILFIIAIFLAICNGILVLTNIRLANIATDNLN